MPTEIIVYTCTTNASHGQDYFTWVNISWSPKVREFQINYQ